jgi:hypothetical protein
VDGVSGRRRRLPGWRAHGVHQPGRRAARPAEDFFRAHGADPSAGDGRLRHAGLGRLAAGGGGFWQPLGGAGLLDVAAALPAFLCSVAMGLMALVELVRGTPLNLGHSAEVE